MAETSARALDWQRETAEARCPGCDMRVGRQPAELALDQAIEAYKVSLPAQALPKRAAAITFGSEAPTVPKRRRK